MKKSLFLGLLILIILSSCHKKITITGMASVDKGGAIVETDSATYFIDGLEEGWNEKYAGKKMQVRGRLVIENRIDNSTDSMIIGGVYGKIAIIKKAKWKLVD